MKRYTILTFVIDRPGTLNKISMLIRKKMYNIDTLTVCESKKPGVSRMTMTLKADERNKVEKMVKQIEKLIEVITAEIIDPDKSFWREVSLIKVDVDRERLEDLEKEYFFKILEESEQYFLIQLAGTIDNVDEFIKEVGDENIVEIARTGPTAIKI
jgi:acetolactate synthase-1/3 small subunit